VPPPMQAAHAHADCLGLQVDVLGGGRMHHEPQRRTLSIYGYSSAFGAAPHEVTAALVRRWRPFYSPSDVRVSYEGY